MQTSSADYKTAIAATERDIRGYIKFNNTYTMSGADGLISFKTTQNAMDAERFCVGSTTSCFCEATFYNSGLEGSGVSLANSYFDAYIGVVLPDTTVEYICCGRYWVSEITRGKETTKIVGYDVAGRLSMDYVPTVTADPDDGYLVMDVLNDIISQTGVNGSTPFTTYGDSTYVPNIYEGNCRAQWGWLCSLVDAEAASYTATREPADLGYMKKYVAGNGEVTPYAVDESTTYLDGASFGDQYTITSFTTGTTDTPIVIGNGTGLYGLNPYMDNAIATTIEGTMDGYQYYPATLHWRGDPCLDILDEINVTKGEDTFKVVVMKIETTFNGGLEQTITCFGDSEEYYALSTSPTQGAINRVSSLVQDIQQAIETADGGVITKILDTDGTWKELVIANNQDLSQATSVWRFNINGLAHANRYSGGTYTLAMDTQGRIVANVIQTGILQDANGYNSWNLDTGALTITNGSVNITTSDETDDIIQFNGDSRNAQGLGFTYHTQMQPLKFRAEGHFYTPTTVTTDHVGWADMSVKGGTDITGTLDLAGGEMSKEHEGYVNFAYILSLNYGGVYGRFYREYQGIDRTVFSLTGTGVRFFDSSETLTAEYPATGLSDIPAFDQALHSTAITGKLINLGNIGGSTIGVSSTSTDAQVAEAWLKYICTKYTNAQYCIFRGTVSAGLVRTFDCTIYDTADTSGGLPNVSYGTMRKYTDQEFSFGTATYAFHFHYSNGYATRTYTPSNPSITTSTQDVVVYDFGYHAIVHVNINITSGFGAGTVYVMCNIGDGTRTLPRTFFTFVPSQTGTSVAFVQVEPNGNFGIYRYSGSNNFTGWLRCELPIVFNNFTYTT